MRVRIAGNFVFRSAVGAECAIDLEGDPVLLAPVLAVCRQAVQRGLAFKDGRAPWILPMVVR